MHHYRKTLKRYKTNNAKNAASQSCPFCDEATYADRLFETKLSYVLRNIVEYDLWESHKVAEHLMIVPKRHVASIAKMTDEEKLDMLKIVAEYEQQGYNVYARGVNSPTRSIEHQHTHLIRVERGLARFLFHLKKPHVLIRF